MDPLLNSGMGALRGIALPLRTYSSGYPEQQQAAPRANKQESYSP